ncbi:hypothetical protein L3Q82_001611 [Scortum barcoo]|uniref:Uncharacterized protein n=1 Tax=Scortum barcoo TaxID=214431 RepID=A0ACB8W3X0_9TELE|nr:hypothetical protein L3Q82_001611 [Scortum barcoo]
MENYSAMKLELLGLKWAVTDKFRDYLIGGKFMVFTDNNPLSHLNTAKLGAGVSELARFDFQIVYRPGTQNAGADALSRQYLEREGSERLAVAHTFQDMRDALARLHQVAWCQEAEAGLVSQRVSMSSFPSFDMPALASLQRSDPVIASFRAYWGRGSKPCREERDQECRGTVELLRQWGRMVELEGVLYRELCDQKEGLIRQLLLPAVLQGEVLTWMHTENGHQGVERTFKLVRSRCYWPGMFKDVEAFCKTCERCIVSKAPQPKVVAALGSLLTFRPLEVVAMDFTVLEPSDGRENVLVLTDVFSKFMVAVPTRDQRAVTVAKALVICWIQPYALIGLCMICFALCGWSRRRDGLNIFLGWFMLILLSRWIFGWGRKGMRCQESPVFG